MSGKPSLPRLPPLSLKALSDLREIEDYAQEALRDCDDPAQILGKSERAREILHTCFVEALDVRLAYYSSLSNYQPVWIIGLIGNTIDSFIELFPLFIPDKQSRMEFLGTAADHLKARGVKYSKPLVPTDAQPEIAPGASPTLPVPVKAADSVGAQIDRLREECHLTVEALAEGINIDVRSVRRHLRDRSVPYDRHLWAYEKLFSKLLNRQVVINKMP